MADTGKIKEMKDREERCERAQKYVDELLEVHQRARRRRPPRELGSAETRARDPPAAEASRCDGAGTRPRASRRRRRR